MRRSRLLIPLLAAALALSGVAGPLSAVAADVDATAGYTITLGGINIADAKVHFTDAADTYDLALEANVSGLGALVASGTAKAESSGTTTPTGLSAQKFALLTHANGEDFSVTAGFTHGDVTEFVVTPPIVNNINRVPIERSQLTGNIGDMLAAFILRGDTLDANLCNRRMQVFTGVERFDLGLAYIRDDKATSLRTAYQGPVIQCRIKYTPISGHFTTSQMTTNLAQSDQLYIWYAPLGTTGYFIPYRVLIATTSGDLSMVLVSLKD